MTPQTRTTQSSSITAPDAHALARDAHARHPRAALAALLCAGSVVAHASSSHKPRAPKAASTPSTAQILAPSAATVPDALPTDERIYRCGNTYSAHACGDAKPLAVADARSDAQRRQSEELTARDKRLAAWLEGERREREAIASAPKSALAANSGQQCRTKKKAACPPDGTAQRPSREVTVMVVPNPGTGKPK